MRPDCRTMRSGSRLARYAAGEQRIVRQHRASTPTMIVECPAHLMHSHRAASPLTQLLSPEADAVLPSSVIAYLYTTNGVRCWIKWKNTSFPAASTPVPARETRPPRPASRTRRTTSRRRVGLGSVHPTTTRAIPRSKIASVQGGVCGPSGSKAPA